MPLLDYLALPDRLGAGFRVGVNFAVTAFYEVRYTLATPKLQQR
jgi:hypothetical protein